MFLQLNMYINKREGKHTFRNKQNETKANIEEGEMSQGDIILALHVSHPDRIPCSVFGSPAPPRISTKYSRV